MGDLLGSFPGNCASEDKACWKDSCCYREASCQVGMLQMVSERTSPSTVWFGDEPSGRWWACDPGPTRAGSDGRCTEARTRNGSWQASRWRDTRLNRYRTRTRGNPRLYRYGTIQLRKV